MPAPTGAVIALVVIMAVHAVVAQGPPEDEVTYLPGLANHTTFKQYSGFLRAGGTRRLHYWFIGSERSPETDPVILWMNGGPGCSSLLGLMSEQGPFRVVKRGHKLIINPYRWNQIANIIFLESPAGVGYSYDLSGQYSTNDDQTADDNYLALQDFFTKFPSLKTNDFYIAGESYGGIYVPMLTLRVLKDPKDIRLKGYAIGNGALDFNILGNALVFFGYYHGLYGLSLWTRLTTNCCNGSVSQQSCNFVYRQTSACEEAVQDAMTVIYQEHLNVYNLYDKCEDEEGKANGYRASRASSSSRYHRSKQLMAHSVNLLRHRDNLGVTPPCIDSENVKRYLTRADVKTALHVESSPLEWDECSDVLNYTTQYRSMRNVVKELVDSGTLKTLIYNGDIDMACNFLGDEWFVNTLGYNPTSTYKIWKHGEQVAGFFQTYENNITFVTIKGAGHMVPEDKPAQSLEMIENFINDTPF
ncbi:lysosomal protective protein-like [Dermacentor silvarum]|uniref:lysosomal protective protein-like n=1 Tax=Dermacentor silvarum TaxID=543639 RepID=UPI001898F2FB|nr:lysosomal protective protein-like [Dermacentor silvarum]XP_049514432.1 lysosomal protective protein-like [Dermacentor silvarum]